MNTTLTNGTGRRIFADLFRVGTLTASVKVAGAAKVAVTAWVFGTSGDLDAYLIAFLIPSFFADVLAGSITAALVPALLSLGRRSRSAVIALYQNILAGSVMLLAAAAAVLSGVVSMAIPAISSISDERIRLIHPLLLIMLPVLPLAAANVVWRALLHAEQRFGAVAAAPAVTPLLSMALLFSFGSLWGVYVLAVGTLGGTVIEMCILAGAVRHQGYPILPRWKGLSSDVRSVISDCIPFVAGTLILGGAIFVDQGFAILLGSGSVALLSYGTKLTTVIAAVGGATVGSVSLPYLSRLAAAQNWIGLRQAMTRSLYMIALVAIPSTAILIWFSEPLVRLYLQRGMFSAEMAREVAWVQQFSLLQIPLAIALALVLRLMAALRANFLLWRVALVTLAANAVADAVLMQFLGVAGIAAADSAAAFATLVLLGFLLAKQTSGRSVTATATSSL